MPLIGPVEMQTDYVIAEAAGTVMFFPWTSLAIAPATVTNFVPGVTGRNQPAGTATSRISANETPASHHNRPLSVSKPRIRLSPEQSRRIPPSLRQESP